MILWLCPKCKEYNKSIHVIVPAIVYCRIEGDDVIYNDPGGDIAWQGPWKLSEVDTSKAKCTQCDTPLEMVEVDTCPHNWRWFYGTEQKCELCGKLRRGKIVFPEEG